MRPEIEGAKRVVVKVGSSSLTDARGQLDPARITQLAELLAGIHERGVRVVLVTSGAIAAALGPLGLRRRPRDLETQQAAAAVGQGLLVRAYSDAFAEHGVMVAQLLLTVEDVLRPRTYRNALNTISRLFRLGVVPIVNENDTVATHEIRFGDNDRLAALIAHLVRADALLLMSDVDGLYTAPDPEDKRSRGIWERRRTELSRLFRFAETNDLGRGSRWGAYSALTEWIDWGTPVRGGDDARAARQFADAHQGMKNRAVELLSA